MQTSDIIYMMIQMEMEYVISMKMTIVDYYLDLAS